MSLPTILSSRLSLPVVAAPLFIISTPELVIAQCKAGIVGSFPALNARPAAELERWLERISKELAEYDRLHPDAPSAPYAVNHIVHKSNDRLDHDLQVSCKYKVPIVITSLGSRPEVNEAIHAYGGVVLHDVISDAFARKAIARGADGLIVVAAGAGGHAGTLSPFALVQEVRAWFDGPLLLSGSIASGASILSALAMGADLAYIGSPFVATREANAEPAYKEMVTQSSAADIVYSNLFSGVHGNYLRPSIRRAGLDPDNLANSDPSQMNFGGGQGKPKAWKEIWGCGQGIGVIHDIPAAGELVARFQREFCAAASALAENPFIALHVLKSLAAGSIEQSRDGASLR